MQAIRTSHRPTRRSPAYHPLLAILFAISFALAGCTVKLIGDYDSTIDTGISDIQQRADLYLNKLQSTPSTPFDQSFYDDISARLSTLKSRASASPQSTLVVQQITALQTQFTTLQQLDQTSARPFPAFAATAAQSAIAVSVESILKLELALKRGSTSPPAIQQ